MTPEAITECLRSLAEDANPARRAEIQACWRELTLREEDRLRSAFFAHPHPRERRGGMDVAKLSADVLATAMHSGDTQLEAGIEDLVLFTAAAGRQEGSGVTWPDLAPSDDPLLDL